jgi:hypothetical protein
LKDDEKELVDRAPGQELPEVLRRVLLHRSAAAERCLLVSNSFAASDADAQRVNGECYLDGPLFVVSNR